MRWFRRRSERAPTAPTPPSQPTPPPQPPDDDVAAVEAAVFSLAQHTGRHNYRYYRYRHHHHHGRAPRLAEAAAFPGSGRAAGGATWAADLLEWDVVEQEFASLRDALASGERRRGSLLERRLPCYWVVVALVRQGLNCGWNENEEVRRREERREERRRQELRGRAEVRASRRASRRSGIVRTLTTMTVDVGEAQREEGILDEYYARFVLRVLEQLYCRPSRYSMWWLADPTYVTLDVQIWILYHTLLLLHLEERVRLCERPDWVERMGSRLRWSKREYRSRVGGPHSRVS